MTDAELAKIETWAQTRVTCGVCSYQDQPDYVGKLLVEVKRLHNLLYNSSAMEIELEQLRYWKSRHPGVD